MTKSLGIRIALGLLFLLYPVMVYVGLAFFDPRWLTTLLVVTAGARFLGGQFPRRMLLLWSGAALLAIFITFIDASEVGLLAYPILVNAVFLALFAWSYINPPSIIESIARKTDPDLPESGVRYTRKVTLVWCVFFLVNGLLSLYSLTQSREFWALYNGMISYILMALLMAAEWLVRQRVKTNNVST
ncbi:Uncharacterised protein [Zhongshania aliphaticivorans]|uniref:DNA gyrase subunit B n=1 Tax=Zhongshania aliphaticivorans TaxID=1470434 RepID=A0A5S9NMN3_9GAMM|nr:hypothetical protein [Zhongshania aliphaticivorans]CAA0091578.1 Uncharacterised protein [Zhongshania aliphaticivorans]CAA0098927.1 Uncharacterised protein [Zhongshania aliphaticivorans]